MKGKHNLAIFASGSGTNAEAIIRYFSGHENIRVALVLTNKPDAYVLERAKKYSVDTYVFDREEFRSEQSVLPVLTKYGVTYIALAGFLWLVPGILTHEFEHRILNIHPALLPKYGGKGMYGMNVHAAVLEAGDPFSGITIHYVNRNYDEGAIVFQAKCEVLPGDNPESLASRIHKLEHQHYPRIIEEVINAS